MEYPARRLCLKAVPDPIMTSIANLTKEPA
jgi:hypothetical protein